MTNKVAVSNVEALAASFLKAMEDYMKAARILVEGLADMNEDDRQETVDLIVGHAPTIKDWVERMAACASRGLIGADHLFNHTQVMRPTQITFASAKAIGPIANPEHEFEIVTDDGSVYIRKMSDINRRELSKCWNSSSGIISSAHQREEIRKRAKHIPAPNGDKVRVKSAVLTADDKGRQYIDIVVTDSNGNGIESNIAIPVADLRKILK